MIKRSMFFRLLLIYVCTVLISLGVVGFTLSYVTETYITNSKKEDMVRKAKKVNLAIRDFPHMPDDVKAMLVFLDQAFDSRIWVFDEQGQIIASSSQEEIAVGKKLDEQVVAKILAGETAEVNLNFGELTEPLLSVVVPWGKEDRIYGGIILHSPLTALNKTVQDVRENDSLGDPDLHRPLLRCGVIICPGRSPGRCSRSSGRLEDRHGGLQPAHRDEAQG